MAILPEAGLLPGRGLGEYVYIGDTTGWATLAEMWREVDDRSPNSRDHCSCERVSASSCGTSRSSPLSHGPSTWGTNGVVLTQAYGIPWPQGGGSDSGFPSQTPEWDLSTYPRYND